MYDKIRAIYLASRLHAIHNQLHPKICHIFSLSIFRLCFLPLPPVHAIHYFILFFRQSNGRKQFRRQHRKCPSFQFKNIQKKRKEKYIHQHNFVTNKMHNSNVSNIQFELKANVWPFTLFHFAISLLFVSQLFLIAGLFVTYASSNTKKSIN